jgi:putative membrane protein
VSAQERRPRRPKPSAADRGDEADWQRLHPLTPLLKGGGLIAALGTLAVINFEDWPDVIDAGAAVGWHWVALAAAGLVALVLTWTVVWWRRAYFHITDSALEWASGVVFRARRTIRLDRVEAVDTVRPPISRLLGLVKLKIESAGGSGSSVELAYLKVSDAARWRHQILARAALAKQEAAAAPAPAAGAAQPGATLPGADSVAAAAPATPATPEPPAGGPPTTLPGAAQPDADSVDTAAPATPGPPAGGPPATLPGAAQPGADSVATAAPATPEPPAGGPPTRGSSSGGRVPPKSVETQVGELLGDCDSAAPELFAVPTRRVLMSLAVALSTWAFAIWALAGVALAIWGPPGSAAAALPALLGFGGYLRGRLISDFGFSAKQTERGLTLSHGLTTRVSQTIAPGRVLAVELNQGPIWRHFGWWHAEMSVAGYGNEDSDKQSVLAPIADADTLRRAVWAVAPALAQSGAWELVTSAMNGSGPTPGFTGQPERSRLFDPLAWRRKAFAATDEVLILRGGWLNRTVRFVYHGRVQAIALHQGPWDRRRGLALVQLHLPDGPVAATISHLDQADALALVNKQSDRLNAAMRATLAARDQAPPAEPQAT